MGWIQISSTNKKNCGNLKQLDPEIESRYQPCLRRNPIFNLFLILILFMLIYFILHLHRLPVICKLEKNHTYKESDEVILWMDDFNHENDAASCLGFHVTLTNHCYKTYLESLLRHTLIYSGLYIEFRGNISRTEYCEIELMEERLKYAINAVKNHNQYHMYFDKFDLKGDIGEVEEKNGTVSYYIYTHKQFDFTYKDNHIVDVKFTENLKKVELATGARISFTYGVDWYTSI